MTTINSIIQDILIFSNLFKRRHTLIFLFFLKMFILLIKPNEKNMFAVFYLLIDDDEMEERKTIFEAFTQIY